jgi:acyl-[acyl-carrier-protein]-phospholipid O-acyltransferase/long-chain-fatty-acid--[acyl-carrier-protein] ligase
MASIFLMGCHSAIFGPSKYGILPELLPLEKLSWGNGLLELLSFLGIILGTVAGGFLASGLKGSEYICGLLLAVIAFAGWRISRGITRVPAANPHCPPQLNPVRDLWRQMKIMRGDRDLWRAVWGNTGFFFVAALIQVNLVLHANDVLHLAEWQNGLLNAALALGIGFGSAAAGWLSRGRIEYGLVPLGAIGLSLSAVPLGWPGLGVAAFSVWLALLGLSGGLFIVPIAAVIQHRPPSESKGAVQGATNLLSFIGIALASGVQFLMNHLHFTSGHVFWFCGAAALGTGIYTAASRPGALRNLLQSFFNRAS